ncbi:toxin-antitoxin system YwqK family antitoxin [uncultured Fusobacterium sp.]|uniref:toxin-antitoxin system YwqK family antitoxin n=1 Tax=uncultured Fusobacterium sp. TaxID=159267 RepID=UPI0015A55A7D|nr:hypothetical protein [uncultured Fusobacterium sp.]
MSIVKVNSACLTNIERPQGNNLVVFIKENKTYLGLARNYDDKGNYNNDDFSLYKVSDRNACFYLLSSNYSHKDIKELIKDGSFIQKDFEEAKKAKEIYSNNLYNEKSKKDGLWIEFHKNNKIAGVYENGSKEGEWRIFSNDDVLLKLNTYKDNLLNGPSVDFFDNSSIKSSKEYKDGKLDGKVIEYFDEKNVFFEGVYKNGLLNGKAKEYFVHADGSSSYSEGYYVNSEKQGLWKGYDSEGNLCSEQFYVDNERDGTYKQYTKAGTLKHTEEWEYGEKLNSVDYYPNEKVKLIEQWADGKRNGIAEVYFESGPLKEQYNYTDNKLDGNALEYDLEGTLIKNVIYKDGELIKDIFKDNNKELKKEIENINSSGIEKINQFDENGKQGKWLELRENTYKCEGTYVDDKKNGPWIETFGDWTFKGNYKNNERDGEYIVTSTTKDLKNIIVEKGQYLEGKLDGNIKIYNDFSELKYEREYSKGLLKKETEFLKNQIFKETEYKLDNSYDYKEYYTNGKLHYHSTPNLSEEYYNNGIIKQSIEKNGIGNFYDEQGNLTSSYKTLDFELKEKINSLSKDKGNINPWSKGNDNDKSNAWTDKINSDKNNQWER